ncbi:MAG TPA: cyclase family protein [Candidatus Cloacimonadota bacterium]|nr:cyclase family protein [Candidatus Cloacimonadota bacterium]
MKIYDISVLLNPDTVVYWPGTEKLIITQTHHVSQDGYNESHFKMNCHLGTHFDTSSHFIENAYVTQDYSIDRFIGQCYVINALGESSITADLLKEKKIPENITKLLIRCNDLFSEDLQNFNTNYVALNQSAADWIVNREIDLVGIDYLSVELYKNDHFKVHKTLLKNGIIVLESLNLYSIDEGIYNLYALPLKLYDTEASPVRAVLIKEDL